jgi:hypothetical protein
MKAAWAPATTRVMRVLTGSPSFLAASLAAFLVDACQFAIRELSFPPAFACLAAPVCPVRALRSRRPTRGQLCIGRKSAQDLKHKDCALFEKPCRRWLRTANEQPPFHASSGALNDLTGNHMGVRSLLLFTSTIALLSLTPVQAGNFDGPWSVELSTEQGQCGLNYKGQLNVSAGHIAESGMFVQTSGAVDASGRVAIHMTHGSDRLAAGGRLQGASGGGQWHSPTQQCSGRWRAARL